MRLHIISLIKLYFIYFNFSGGATDIKNGGEWKACTSIYGVSMETPYRGAGTGGSRGTCHPNSD